MGCLESGEGPADVLSLPQEDAQKAGAGGVREGRKRRDGDDEEEEGEDEGEGEGVSPLGRGASLGAREAQGPATEAAMGPESVHTPIRPKRGVPRVVCYKEPDLHAKIRKVRVVAAALRLRGGPYRAQVCRKSVKQVLALMPPMPMQGHVFFAIAKK
jgi:hypothetical protein